MSNQQISLPFGFSAEDSHARGSASLDAESKTPSSTTRDQVFGPSTIESSRSSSPTSWSSKTLRASLRKGWTELSVTSSGEAIARMLDSSELPTSATRIVETGSSLWATPTVGNATGGNLCRGGVRSGEMLLPGQVLAALWPTPVTTDANGARRVGQTPNSHTGETLTDAVLWPTPTAAHYETRNNGNPGDSRTEYATKGSPSLDTMAVREGGSLNPAWVSQLMGFPDRWTDLSADEVKSSKPGKRRE